MNQNQIDQEKSLNKLIDILKIVELDFECLSCSKIKPGFLKDLTGRLEKTILKKEEKDSGFNRPGIFYFLIIFLEKKRLKSYFALYWLISNEKIFLVIYFLLLNFRNPRRY